MKRQNQKTMSRPAPGVLKKCPCGCGRQLIELDARGLKPSTLLAKILQELPCISEEIEIQARTDQRPLHLYAHLDERGYIGRTEAQKDGSFATYIHRCRTNLMNSSRKVKQPTKEV